MNDPREPQPAVCPFRRWREDFPIEWEEDHYVTRRELTKFLTLGSALLVGANGLIAGIGLTSKPGNLQEVRIGRADEVPPGGSLLFRFPTEEDPCILVRDAGGALQAFSQVCTHLACGVVHRPDEGALFCPCHRGYYADGTGEPTAGPPTRRLPRIVLEERDGELFAVGIEV